MRIVHVVHRFGTGGLENGLVNLINHLPNDFTHTVVSLTDSDNIVNRIVRKNVEVFNLQLTGGGVLSELPRIRKLLRALQPDVLHTRNLGTIEVQLATLGFTSVYRVHSEHGWDTYDPHGQTWRYKFLRKSLSGLIHQWIALSRELENWLINDVRIPAHKVLRICNGVDTDRIRPSADRKRSGHCHRFVTITRLSEIKDPLNTLDAFFEACARAQKCDLPYPMLTIVGDGPLMPKIQTRVSAHDFGKCVTLAGQHQDIVPYLHNADAFVLGSQREGISNTLLEAMAAGLPIVATRVGGTPELVSHGDNGLLKEPKNASDLANGMIELMKSDHQKIKSMCDFSRQRAEQEFSLKKMVAQYECVYRSQKQSGLR